MHFDGKINAAKSKSVQEQRTHFKEVLDDRERGLFIVMRQTNISFHLSLS